MDSKKLKKEILIGITAIILSIGACFALWQATVYLVIYAIAESHVEANIPIDKDFDLFLRRDLQNFASKQYGSTTSVEYELLRNGTTQTGVSYPKYYVWVKIKNGDDIYEGAARIAAIDKSEFKVTDWLPIETIKNYPEAIYNVFPKPVCDKINEKIKLLK